MRIKNKLTLLQLAPRALPVALSLHSSKIKFAFPLPYKADSPVVMVNLEIEPEEHLGMVMIKWTASQVDGSVAVLSASEIEALERACSDNHLGQDLDPTSIVAIVEAAIRGM